MAMSTVEYAHIAIGADGVPMLAGTPIKVVEIVLDHLAHGSDAQEIHREFPHLSLGQIHSVLAYYYDHQDEVDADIAQRMRRAEEFRGKFEALLGPSPLRLKLKAKGLLP
jgi:uncharacterized protein (DUF433 family)